MKKILGTSLGVLMGIAFLAMAVAIIGWDLGKLQLARDSQNWPRVEGTVIRSLIDSSRSERRPRVVYTYKVKGVPYRSSQISFDLFDKSGGVGRIETIISRYPVGKTVTVYYRSGEPATAILEPGVYAPFFMPLMFAAVFLFFGVLAFWQMFRASMASPSVIPPVMTANNRVVLALFLSATFYVIIVLVSLSSAVRETFVKAFGEHPAGIPNIAFVIGLQTLLYLPVPWMFWHAAEISLEAVRDGHRIGIGYLLTAGNRHPHLRRSQNVCIAGLVYFVVLCGAWGLLASIRGI